MQGVRYNSARNALASEIRHRWKAIPPCTVHESQWEDVDIADRTEQKYTRHPSKPGFIVLLTDLTKVHFEPLVGIRLLARQREVEEQHGESQRKKDGGGSSLDMGGEEAVAEVMDGLDGLMGPELEDAELSVASGDLYVSDRVNVSYSVRRTS